MAARLRLLEAPLRARARASDIFEAETWVMRGLKASPAVSQIQGPMLTVVSGVDSGRSFALEDGPLVVGRASSCDLRLTDNSVSRSHLIVELADGECLVHDVASSNGTHVNQTQLEGRRLLCDGDLIQIGESIFRYHDGCSESLRKAAASGRAKHANEPVKKNQRTLRLGLSFLVGMLALLAFCLLVRQCTHQGAPESPTEATIHDSKEVPYPQPIVTPLHVP